MKILRIIKLMIIVLYAIVVTINLPGDENLNDNIAKFTHDDTYTSCITIEEVKEGSYNHQESYKKIMVVRV